MKSVVFEKKFIAAMLLGTLFLAACGDDDSFAPVSRAEADQSLSSSSQGADGSEKGGTHSSSSSVDSIASLQNDKSSSSQGSSSSLQTKYEYKLYLEVKGEQFNPNIDYGTMTDPRDGKTYRTVNVEGKTWMAENLNYAGNEIGVSACFNDEDRFCELYGRLYSRDAAMNSSICAFDSSCSLGSDTIQGICPDGWHIPSKKEAEKLISLASKLSDPLMSKKGWAIEPGTDTYGLSFVGSGRYDATAGFGGMSEYGYTWIHYNSPWQYYLDILFCEGSGRERTVSIRAFPYHEIYCPIRCIKDE